MWTVYDSLHSKACEPRLKTIHSARGSLLMFDDTQDPVASLVHLYVDGAFNRRELLHRVAAYTGSMAAAIAAVGGFSEARADNTPGCPVDASVPADAPDLNVSDVQFPGDAGMIFGHL